ncbi:CocE/NonD family hydrolase [Streptomyces sp. B21-102]|uniref:CocE/NonD family hydrolase n=1 Tax=Streptomyces sp. B21-102 TaxID=3039416 RepID=UPI002FF22DC2
MIKQPWFGGSMVLFGASHLGFVQWAVADQLPPQVKAMIPMVTESAPPPWSSSARTDSPWSHRSAGAPWSPARNAGGRWRANGWGRNGCSGP